MKVSIFVPSLGKVAGGPLVLYQHANLLARRGHEVHVGHIFIYMESPRQPLIENASWFRFAEGIDHHCLAPRSEDEAHFERWDSDVMVGQTREFPHHGLPSFLFQGWFLDSYDALRAVDGPIACVSRHLADVCLEEGIAAERVFLVPNAVDHEVMRGGLDPDDRGRTVALQLHPYPTKGTPAALRAVRAARERVPDLHVIAFGEAPPPEVPDWMTFVEAPDQETLAGQVFGRARAFLCTSAFEGFGLTSLEAMACGAALVTYDTRGSRDFALDRRTALVSAVDDVDSLVDDLVAVLSDDGLHREVAAAGTARAADFTWERSGALMEEMLLTYLADPDRFRLPG